MITYEELHKQNHKITELTNVLGQLFGDRLLCDSKITHDLFFDYVDHVKAHMEVIDKKIFPKLLSHSDQEMRKVADRFMGGSKEIKRIFSAYVKTWCRTKNRTLMIKDYDRFMKETNEMFDMVLDRIQDETEHLYPLIKKMTGDSQKAA